MLNGAFAYNHIEHQSDLVGEPLIPSRTLKTISAKPPITLFLPPAEAEQQNHLVHVYRA